MRVLTAIAATVMLACNNVQTAESRPPEPVLEPDPDPPWMSSPPTPPRASPAPVIERGESSWTVEGSSTTIQTHIRVDKPTPPDSEPTDASPAGSCCRMCHKGKACGNTCIPRDRVCHTPPGCACDD